MRWFARFLVKRHIRKTDHGIARMPAIYDRDGTNRVHIYCLDCEKEWVI